MKGYSTRRSAKRLAGIGIVALGAALVGTACGSSSGTSNSKVSLTLWQNYGTESNATATNALVSAFEKLHPNISISVSAQPAANYFALLQAAAISHTGPDLAVMWTGLFSLQYKSYLENLKSWIPASALNQLSGMRWVAPGFDTNNGAYVIPLEDQFYIGFYNKSLFTKAGITHVPQTWSQLTTDCQAFKAMGKNCLYYGADTQALGAEFYPYYDLSYLMIGAFTLPQWEGLYSGKLPWTSPVVEAQLSKWAALHANGYTNQNVISSADSLIAFEQGKTAMIVDGNWNLAALYQVMGSSLGTFVPPFSDTPINGVVQFPGDGFSMTTYSQHKPEAAAFLRFLTTKQAAAIVDVNGLIPDVVGSTTTNPVSQDMLNFAAKAGMTIYPMLDNVTQVDVVNAGSKVLPELLAGQITVAAACQALQQALQHLPQSQRGSTWASFSTS
jgi:ABC-type glycerol-3-phosphate transport system substrate-binding protein